MRFYLLPVLGLVVGCSSSSSPTENTTPNDGGNTDGGGTTIPLKVEVPCTDSLESIYTDPGALTKADDQRGKILKCAADGELTKDDLEKKLGALAAKGAKPATGVKVFRVLYQTERGDSGGSAGYSSARVYVPNDPVALGALPSVVVASGTRGQAGACAASKMDPASTIDQALTMAYSAASSGLPVMVHDGAGYANYGKVPAPGYAFAQDTARSMIDGARAMKKLLPALSDKTSFVGHSHGGHIALSAVALSTTYGAGLKVAAAAVYSPFWISQRSWGSILNKSVASSLGLTIAASQLTSAVSVWYHYSHAELLDGPGEGIKLFVPEKRAAVQKFLDEYCLLDPNTTQLSSVGAEYIAEIFEPALVNAVQFPATGVTECGDTDALCKKWIARYVGDRPRIADAAKNVPILVTYGSLDTTIPKERMSCAVERLRQDGANFSMCYKNNATHSTVVPETAADVAAWLLHTAAGGPSTKPTCDNDVKALDGVACANPPTND